MVVELTRRACARALMLTCAVAAMFGCASVQELHAYCQARHTETRAIAKSPGAKTVPTRILLHAR